MEEVGDISDSALDKFLEEECDSDGDIENDPDIQELKNYTGDLKNQMKGFGVDTEAGEALKTSKSTQKNDHSNTSKEGKEALVAELEKLLSDTKSSVQTLHRQGDKQATRNALNQAKLFKQKMDELSKGLISVTEARAAISTRRETNADADMNGSTNWQQETHNTSSKDPYSHVKGDAESPPNDKDQVMSQLQQLLSEMTALAKTQNRNGEKEHARKSLKEAKELKLKLSELLKGKISVSEAKVLIGDKTSTRQPTQSSLDGSHRTAPNFDVWPHSSSSPSTRTNVGGQNRTDHVDEFKQKDQNTGEGTREISDSFLEQFLKDECDDIGDEDKAELSDVEEFPEDLKSEIHSLEVSLDETRQSEHTENLHSFSSENAAYDQNHKENANGSNTSSSYGKEKEVHDLSQANDGDPLQVQRWLQQLLTESMASAKTYNQNGDKEHARKSLNEAKGIKEKLRELTNGNISVSEAKESVEDTLGPHKCAQASSNASTTQKRQTRRLSGTDSRPHVSSSSRTHTNFKDQNLSSGYQNVASQDDELNKQGQTTGEESERISDGFLENFLEEECDDLDEVELSDIEDFPEDLKSDMDSLGIKPTSHQPDSQQLDEKPRDALLCQLRELYSEAKKTTQSHHRIGHNDHAKQSLNEAKLINEKINEFSKGSIRATEVEGFIAERNHEWRSKLSPTDAASNNSDSQVVPNESVQKRPYSCVGSSSKGKAVKFPRTSNDASDEQNGDANDVELLSWEGNGGGGTSNDNHQSNKSGPDTKGYTKKQGDQDSGHGTANETSEKDRIILQLKQFYNNAKSAAHKEKENGEEKYATAFFREAELWKEQIQKLSQRTISFSEASNFIEDFNEANGNRQKKISALITLCEVGRDQSTRATKEALRLNDREAAQKIYRVSRHMKLNLEELNKAYSCAFQPGPDLSPKLGTSNTTVDGIQVPCYSQEITITVSPNDEAHIPPGVLSVQVLGGYGIGNYVEDGSSKPEIAFVADDSMRVTSTDVDSIKSKFLAKFGVHKLSNYSSYYKQPFKISVKGCNPFANNEDDELQTDNPVKFAVHSSSLNVEDAECTRCQFEVAVKRIKTQRGEVNETLPKRTTVKSFESKVFRFKVIGHFKYRRYMMTQREEKCIAQGAVSLQPLLSDTNFEVLVPLCSPEISINKRHAATRRADVSIIHDSLPSTKVSGDFPYGALHMRLRVWKPIQPSKRQVTLTIPHIESLPPAQAPIDAQFDMVAKRFSTVDAKQLKEASKDPLNPTLIYSFDVLQEEISASLGDSMDLSTVDRLYQLEKRKDELKDGLKNGGLKKYLTDLQRSLEFDTALEKVVDAKCKEKLKQRIIATYKDIQQFLGDAKKGGK